MTVGGAKMRGRLQYLHRVTLTTGQVSVSARGEVDPGFYPNTAVLLASALEGERPRIPDVEPASVLAVTADGACLLATVSRVDDGGLLEPLVTIGVSPRPSQKGASLWRRMHRVSSKLSTRADQAPEQPWCAFRLEPDLFRYPEAGAWISCLERCIAWTWTSYIEDGHWPGIH